MVGCGERALFGDVMEVEERLELSVWRGSELTRKHVIIKWLQTLNVESALAAEKVILQGRSCW